MPEMAPEAMEALSAAVRRLRPFLEEDLARQLDRRFRLSVPVVNADLGEREQVLRTRLEAWLDERARARVAEGNVALERARSDVRDQALSEMAALALLRLFLLRHLEACGVSRPALLSGGWSSKGYLEFRTHAPGLAEGDEGYEGLGLLLKLLFDELGVDLPGLYGERPLDRYFALSPAALREVVAVLNAPELATAWEDDTTLGWVYQFWNDPQREAIDERVGPRGKVSTSEIASKTQLFTERYMVEWLLENSIGRIALAMRNRRQHGSASAPPAWPMFVSAAGTLPDGRLPTRLSELRVLDPACGSGHFLAGAFDLLVPLYREEARDSGEDLSDEQIGESILRHNLHGIDIDSRAVQVAAAVLYLKARRLSRRGCIPPMNLVSTAFDLDRLGVDDPALTALVRVLPEGRRNVAEVVSTLRHVGFRGSLIRFSREARDPELFEGTDPSVQLERFILDHTHADDLGVRFDGDQLAAGLRLRRLLVDGRYDVVAFNPPYLATSKIELPDNVLAEAFADSPDLFASFVERAFELCKPTGLIAFVALSNWMFLASFRSTRERILGGHIMLLADVGKGAFRRASKLIQSAMVVASPKAQPGTPSLAARVGSRDGITASQVVEIADALREPGSYQRFDPTVFARVEGAPLLFWLDAEFMRRYGELPKIGEVAECIGGIATTGNERFLRAVWEVPVEHARAAASGVGGPYVPYLKGAEGREWIEPYRWVLRADRAALELRVLLPNVRVEQPEALGVAYTTIGHRFGTRLHTVRSVRDVSGASVFSGPDVTVEDLVCSLNRTPVRELASALNPTVNFQLGDVRRLAFDRVEGAAEIVHRLRDSFAEEERASELSLEYRQPLPSSWEEAQVWAQAAVDRPPGAPLPPLTVSSRTPSTEAFLSHALGVTLGRFGENGAGVGAPAAWAAEMPLLFVSVAGRDHIDSPHAERALRPAWDAHAAALGQPNDPEHLREYLRKSFFDFHKKLYENRPIYFPLSSAKKSFVAFVSIHCWTDDTLNLLLADHLVPLKRRLEGELDDLRIVKGASGNKSKAEKRFTDVQKLLEELNDFIAKVTETAEKGPPTADGKTPPREADARFSLELDDGVLVNAAALWPLLEPQWKDPKKWWKELATGQGKKHYDWSRTAGRYFPQRVRSRCMSDASLAVAQRCFWELHSAKAYTWELRLQDEIGPNTTIDEPGSDEVRAKFLRAHARDAAEILAKEMKRRERKGAKEDAGENGPLFEAAGDEGELVDD